MSNINITVIIITYNQEKLIAKTLESLIFQKDWIYEIVICDDCSTDNNWSVIREYSQNYPDLIKSYRNDTNLGHIGNWIKSWSKATGNLIYMMAGDDTVNDGLFKKSHEVVGLKAADCDEDAFSIHFDFKTIYPNGSEKVFSNKLVAKGFDPISLKLRGLIWNRTVLYSKKVMQKFKPIRNDLGIYSDVLIEFQIPNYSDKVYYYPFIGNNYYYGIGIASKTKRHEHWRSIILVLNELEKTYCFNQNDKNWIKYKISFLSFYINPNYKDLLKTWGYYLISRNLKYEFDLKNPIRMAKMLLEFNRG